MKEVLWWGDSPTVSTGFGTVSRNLLSALHATGKYRFTVLGVSHLGLPFDVDKFPYLKFPDNGGLYPALEGQDVYGFRKVVQMLSSGAYDVLFILQDPFVLQHVMPQIIGLRQNLKKKFSIVYYFPLDMPPKAEWVKSAIAQADFPVTYTEYARNGIAAIDPATAERVRVIHHGTDKAAFAPMLGDARDLLRKTIWGDFADRFIILNVNRNQPRKDLNKTFEVFAKVKRKHPDAYLYVLAAMNDVGGNLREIAAQHGLEYGKDWNSPPETFYTPNQGMPQEMVHNLYVASDLVMTTTLGEGWGLSMTEAMSCGIPVIAPRHTSLPEIVGENEERGWLAHSGGDGNTICLGPLDNSIVRPMVDTLDMADKIGRIIKYPGQSKKKIAAALAWVKDWHDLGHEWASIFDEACILVEARVRKDHDAIAAIEQENQVAASSDEQFVE